MIDFREITLEDRKWAEPILFATGVQSCDNTFTVMYTWKNAYGIRIAGMGGFVLCQMNGIHGTVYLYPKGRGEIRPVLEALRQDAFERGVEFRLVCVTPDLAEELKALYPGRFRYEAYRDSFDYIYGVDQLADLKGKKLHGKRNHINRFLEDHPDWSMVPVTPKNLALCRQVEECWQAEAAAETDGSSDEAENQNYEGIALELALRDFEALGLDGIIILTEGRPIAFALGKQVSEESYNIHFEKAISAVQGSYAIVNREYARWIREHCPGVRYINREDDMGVPGLRAAKESYRPEFLLEKYAATWLDEIDP